VDDEESHVKGVCRLFRHSGRVYGDGRSERILGDVLREDIGR